MKPLLVLLISFVLTLLVLRFITRDWNMALAGRIAMSIMLAFTAIAHFAFAEGMTAMIPSFLPMKEQLVTITGVMEFLFAIALLLPNYRTVTGWLLIAFFLAILPANIKASLEHINYQTGTTDGPGLMYLWFLIPLQLFFIFWVYFSAVKS